jgi:flagellar FliL protein
MATAKPAKSGAAEVPAAEAKPPKKSKLKLFIILILVLLFLGAGAGGFAVFMMKKKAAEAAAANDEGHDDGEDSLHQEQEAKKKAASIHSGPPVFVVIDPFSVNLADKNSDRYAQVSISLQVIDGKSADELKLYMPIIRNNIFMVLAHKTAEELLEKSGKEALAEEILKEANRPMREYQNAGKDKNRPKDPILKVYFSNFIIQ